MNFVDACSILDANLCEFVKSNLGITYDFCGARKEIYSRPLDQPKANYPISPSVDEILGEWETV